MIKFNMSMGCSVWMINQMENKENKKLNLISLGCAKNLVDSEILLGGFNKTNVELIDDPEKADTIVVIPAEF